MMGRESAWEGQWVLDGLERYSKVRFTFGYVATECRRGWLDAWCAIRVDSRL